MNNLTTKRFVIRKSLIGENKVITFTNSKGITFTYDHDEIYTTFQEKFETMNCFQEYGENYVEWLNETEDLLIDFYNVNTK